MPKIPEYREPQSAARVGVPAQAGQHPRLSRLMAELQPSSQILEWQVDRQVKRRAAGDRFGEFHVPNTRGKVSEMDLVLTADGGDELGLDAPAPAPLRPDL